MNWQQHSGRIYADILEQGKRSVRAIAIATGMTKSSVHRLLQASKRSLAVSRITVVGTSERLPMVTATGVGSGVCVWRQAWHWQ